MGVEVREILVGKRRGTYRALFQIRGHTVHILRVWHSARDAISPDDLQRFDKNGNAPRHVRSFKPRPHIRLSRYRRQCAAGKATEPVCLPPQAGVGIQ